MQSEAPGTCRPAWPHSADRGAPLPFWLPSPTGLTQLRTGWDRRVPIKTKFVLSLGMDAAFRGEAEAWGKWFHTAETERSQTAKLG